MIGTNGSGKSTLLKIVSGALNPTSGRVVVDQRKVQLLTLGTGFDFELSAKENVYLNGLLRNYVKILQIKGNKLFVLRMLMQLMEQMN